MAAWLETIFDNSRGINDLRACARRLWSGMCAGGAGSAASGGPCDDGGIDSQERGGGGGRVSDARREDRVVFRRRRGVSCGEYDEGSGIDRAVPTSARSEAEARRPATDKERISQFGGWLGLYARRRR